MLKTIFVGICGIIAAVFIIFSLDFVFNGESLLIYKFFAPKQEQVRREVFENTKSFVSSNIQELRKYQYEYYKTNDKNVKENLTDMIISTSANMNERDIPKDLKIFIKSLRGEKF